MGLVVGCFVVVILSWVVIYALMAWPGVALDARRDYRHGIYEPRRVPFGLRWSYPLAYRFARLDADRRDWKDYKRGQR